MFLFMINMYHVYMLDVMKLNIQ